MEGQIRTVDDLLHALIRFGSGDRVMIEDGKLVVETTIHQNIEDQLFTAVQRRPLDIPSVAEALRRSGDAVD